MDLFDLYCKITIDDGEFTNGIQRVVENMQKVSGVFQSFTGKASAVDSSFSTAGDAASDAAGEFKQATSSTNDLGTAFDSAADKSLSFADVLKANVLGQAIINGFEKLGSAIKSVSKYIVATGEEFDATMAKVSAVSGATGSDLDDLTAKAREMGATTKFSATEAAEGFTYMAMAGWKTEDMLDGISGIMNLAAASGENLATVSDIVTDALTAFGLAAEDSGHFADVLAAASNSANTNVTMMGESFKYVAPVAGSLGYSIEDVSIALGLMANGGVKASQAGTALRGALSRLVDPTDAMWDAISGLGLALTDASDDFSGILNNVGEYNGILYNSDGSTKSFMDTISTLRDAFSKLNESEKAYYATNLFGQEAMSGMLNIINASDADFAALTESIKNADGTAAAMADTMNNNLPGAIEIAKSALAELALAVYKNISGDAQSAVEKFTEVITKITPAISSFASSIVENGPEIVSTLSAIGAGFIAWNVAGLVSGIAGIVSGAKTMAEVFPLVGKAMTAISANPIGLVITAVASLVVGLITLYNTSEDFRNKVNAAWTAVKETVSGVVLSLVTFFTETIPNAGREMLEFFKSIPGMALQWGQDLIQNFIDGIKAKISALKDTVSNVAQTVKDFLGFSEPKKGPLSNFHTYAPDMMQLFADGIKDNSGLLKNAFNQSLDFGTVETPTDFGATPLGMASSAIVNAMSSGVNESAGIGPVTVNLVLPDGSKFASWLLPDLIKAGSAAGTPIASGQYA